jgi:hypothetical protein
MSSSARRLAPLFVSLVALLPACGGGGNAAQDGTTDVPSFAASVGYLKVAPPLGATDAAPFQMKYPTMTLVFDNPESASPKYDCMHDDISVGEKLSENHQPDGEVCALPKSGAPDATTTAPGDPGTSQLPKGIGASWSGYGKGGCGTWAVAMCNRILGDTDPKSDVTEAEWNGIAKGIHQNSSGGSRGVGRAAYYENKGYCVESESFSGSTASYEALKKKLEDDHCDVKLSYFKRNADGTYSNGHVETVTAATNGGVTTNSWGQEGVVVGGSDGGFRHSLDGKNFRDDAGNPLWPAGSTEVVVQYVCKCPVFSSLVSAMGM